MFSINTLGQLHFREGWLAICSYKFELPHIYNLELSEVSGILEQSCSQGADRRHYISPNAGILEISDQAQQ